jgi:hypothetical protein
MSEGVRRILVRTAMAFGCLGTACYVPFLALVMSLIGSLLTIGTAIILPVAIHSKIFKVIDSLAPPLVRMSLKFPTHERSPEDLNICKHSRTWISGI